ncbi:MAG: helicase C-terminal domain-containing protein [Nitrososphaera sp.]|jgi:Rad3-related DNA helicase
MTSIDLSTEDVLKTCKKEPYDYQSSIISNTVLSLGAGKDVAIQLPTGTGKSFIFLSIALAAADKGYRVCILSPTNLIVDQVERKYLPDFQNMLKPYVAKGIEHSTCLITNCAADYAICTPDQRNSICKKEYSSCQVLFTNKQMEDYGIILTNFHKFLSTQTEKGFDLIVIDDSHGFENAIESKFQTKLHYYQIDKLYKSHESSNDVVADVSGNFLDLFDDIINSIPPKQLKRRIASDNIQEISKIEDLDKFKKIIPSLDVFDRNVCSDLIQFIDFCKNSSLNTFYVEKDFYNPDNVLTTLIAIKSESYQHKIVQKLFGDSSVILVSATMGNLENHAQHCTHRSYVNGGLDVIPQTLPATLEKWFDNLHIFEITDSPEDNSKITNAVIKSIEIISKSPGKTLLLFKNYRDQKQAQEILSSKITDRITFIDDSFNTEDVQSLVDKSEIIMATASSRLWEGIDIKELKLVLIFSLPFPRPPVHLDDRESFPWVRRKMLIRLQQGIGRLIRKIDGKGICIIFDKKLAKYKSVSIFSDSYRKRIVQSTMDEIVRDVDGVIKTWK